MTEDEVPFVNFGNHGPKRDFCFVGIIDDEWVLENEETFSFDKDLVLGPFPKEYREARPGVVFGPVEKAHVRDCQYAFQVRYQYNAVGGYIPGEAYQRYSKAALALWIATSGYPAPPITMNATFGWRCRLWRPGPLASRAWLWLWLSSSAFWTG